MRPLERQADLRTHATLAFLVQGIRDDRDEIDVAVTGEERRERGRELMAGFAIRRDKYDDGGP